MNHRRLVRYVVALSGLSVLLGACSIPADQGVTPIANDGLPPEIANTTTTTTTAPPTTTTTTAPPATSVPPETTAPTIPPPPTTAPPDNAVPLDIYYADRTNSDGMKPLRRLLLGPLSLQNVISQLEQPPDDLASYGVRTALEPGLISPPTLDRSVLTLSLNSSVWDAMSDDQKRLAIAQMVLTFTSFSVPGEGNIGSVIIEVDGTPISVFLPGPGTTSGPGVPLVFDDFSTMLVGASGATTTAPPATSAPPTETTVPLSGPNQ